MERADITTLETLAPLASDGVRALVERHIDERPEQLALRLRNPLVTQQIKLLQKCRQKLPSYYAARCLLSPMAYEQASSEQTAAVHAERAVPVGQKAGLAVDLTCGLGVDSWALSRRFERVIAVETDASRAELARLNFGRLGATNIEVAHTSAEQFLAEYAGPAIDFLYIDPSRKRDDGRRVYALEDSSPNVLELLPLLRQKAARVMLKLSPLFDVDEIWRLFGQDASAEVISLGGECKEVLASLGFADAPPLRITVIGPPTRRQYDFTTGELHARPPEPRALGQEYCFLLVPDVAFYKARAVAAYATRAAPHARLGGEYLFAAAAPAPPFEGKAYRITLRAPYRPKELARLLKSRGIRRADIHRRGFPQSAEQIARSLGVSLGGTTEIFCTLLLGEPTVFFATRL